MRMVQKVEGVLKRMNNLQIIIDELAQMQAGLDEHVNERFNIEQPREYIQQKLLALKVELGELANETRCFKFWSIKEPAERVVILEELVDCIHFALSVGILCNYLLDMDTGKRLYYNSKGLGYIPVSKEELTDHFNLAFTAISMFEHSGQSYSAYLNLLQHVLNLGSSLGFSEQELYEGYIAKNQKNHKRQEEGY